MLLSGLTNLIKRLLNPVKAFSIIESPFLVIWIASFELKAGWMLQYVCYLQSRRSWRSKIIYSDNWHTCSQGVCVGCVRTQCFLTSKQMCTISCTQLCSTQNGYLYFPWIQRVFVFKRYNNVEFNRLPTGHHIVKFLYEVLSNIDRDFY